MTHLGIDFDDTLLDTRRVFLGILNRIYGTDHTYDAVRDYYFSETWGCSSAELERIFTDHFDELHDLLPLPGVAATLRHARALGRKMTIITARPPVHMPPLHDWIARHGIQVDHVISAPKSGEKALRAVESGVDLFIDDNPRHALAIAARDIPVLLLDRPYNHGCQQALITRVMDWHAIAGMLFDSPIKAYTTDEPANATTSPFNHLAT